MTDLVSIIIPVYNTNSRFKNCFESVLKQIYTNIEVVLVDDGSSDESAQMCDAFAHQTRAFSVYVIHTKNGGVSRTRNLGIDFANGKYIVFIDSDDQVTPDHISDLMNIRDKYPESGHIWCGFDCCSQNHAKYLYSENELISFVDRKDYLSLSEKVLTQSPCLRLYNTSILNYYNIRMNETLSLAEDIIFNLEYLDAVPSTKIFILNKANYLYIDTNNESLKNKYRSNLLEINEQYLNVLYRYLTKWKLTDASSKSKFADVVYLKYLEVLNNTFNKNNKASFVQKLKFNNQILGKDAFTDALMKMNVPISSLLKRAYKTKKYFYVWLYEKIVSVFR